MRDTAQFFLYLFACLLLAACLTWPLMQTGWIEHDPQRVMGRLAQVLMVVGLWPFLKTLGIADRTALGYQPTRPEFLRAVGFGWLLGIGILAVLALTLLALEIRVPDPKPLGTLAGKAAAALIGGLLVALLEETFFRGALYSAIARRSGTWAAVFWPALLYAAVHFMKPRSLPDGQAYDWAGNWGIFLSTFTSPWQWVNLDSFAALLLVGVFLGLVRRRTGHIGWCIGLHAGWVFVIQITRKITDHNDSAPLAYLTGDYDGVIGWLAAGWIGVLALALVLARTRKHPDTRHPLA